MPKEAVELSIFPADITVFFQKALLWAYVWGRGGALFRNEFCVCEKYSLARKSKSLVQIQAFYGKSYGKKEFTSKKS